MVFWIGGDAELDESEAALSGGKEGQEEQAGKNVRTMHRYAAVISAQEVWSNVTVLPDTRKQIGGTACGYRLAGWLAGWLGRRRKEKAATDAGGCQWTSEATRSASLREIGKRGRR